jgi:hypothetical protein
MAAAATSPAAVPAAGAAEAEWCFLAATGDDVGLGPSTMDAGNAAFVLDGAPVVRGGRVEQVGDGLSIVGDGDALGVVSVELVDGRGSRVGQVDVGEARTGAEEPA